MTGFTPELHQFYTKQISCIKTNRNRLVFLGNLVGMIGFEPRPRHPMTVRYQAALHAELWLILLNLLLKAIDL